MDGAGAILRIRFSATDDRISILTVVSGIAPADVELTSHVAQLNDTTSVDVRWAQHTRQSQPPVSE